MKKILICTDGSNYSNEACRYAAHLSQITGAAIDVLYVTDLRQFQIPVVADFSGSLGIQPFEGMVGQMHEVEEIKSKFIRENSLKIIRDSGIKSDVNFNHETGMLVDVINGYSTDADLVILGKRGENANFATEHLGSMLERVLRSIHKPCLVTNREFAAFSKLAVAYDGGDSCKKALRFIANHLAFDELELHVITCVEGHDESIATEHLKEAEFFLQEQGVSAQCQIIAGNVEASISAYVSQMKIELLALGAYGHSRIRELLIGSTTTELLRKHHIPVLCCR